MRIAVLADIHANLPALRAVLAELDGDPVDVIVIAGDQVTGPCAGATLDVLDNRPEPVRFISGNGEREALAAGPGTALADGAPGTATWAARDLGERRAALRDWPIRLCLDGVCFCHGSPRRDDEIITRATPEFLEGSPFDPLDPEWVTALFEHMSGRGTAPGEPRRPA